MEVIKEIEGFPNYLISNFGYVISKEIKVKNRQGYRVRKSKILKIYMSRGYQMVAIYKDSKLHYRSLHRLLAKTFLPNPENKPFVNHIDHNRANNNLENLEWCTPKENINAFIIHAKKINKKINRNSGICIVNTHTGVEYNSIREAAKLEKTCKRSLTLKLRGDRFNDTNLRYSENQTNTKLEKSKIIYNI